MSYTFVYEWDPTRLEAVSTRLEAMAPQQVMIGGELVAAVARENVAVDTGSLKDTIDVELVGSTGAGAEASVNAGNTSGGYKGGGRYDSGKEAGSPVDYAAEQEYDGTPYMTPASEQGFRRWVDVFSTALTQLGL